MIREMVSSIPDRHSKFLPKAESFLLLNLRDPETGEKRNFTPETVTIAVLECALDDNAISPENFSKYVYFVAKRDAKIRKNLEEKIGIDPLTGLNNVLVLRPKLNKLIAELNHTSGPKAIMVIALDINNFKPFNEAPYNHDVGDKALLAFVSRMREVTKEWHDALFRKGGDEFYILMPISSDGVDFEEAFQGIQERINKDLFLTEGADTLPISSSMGYAVLKNGEYKTAESLITEADNMERVKKEERKS